MENSIASYSATTVPSSAKVSATSPITRGRDEISREKLARLDFGIFRSLCTLGTDRDRICRVLGLSSDEFDYLRGIS
jgi:hypothetical protein